MGWMGIFPLHIMVIRVLIPQGRFIMENLLRGKVHWGMRNWLGRRIMHWIWGWISACSVVWMFLWIGTRVQRKIYWWASNWIPSAVFLLCWPMWDRCGIPVWNLKFVPITSRRKILAGLPPSIWAIIKIRFWRYLTGRSALVCGWQVCT